MSLSLFNLNTQGGVRLEKVIDYINANTFDIVHLQEVSGGWFSKTRGQDVYKDLVSGLSEYQGIFAKSFTLVNEPHSYFANATFYKKSLSLVSKEVVDIKASAEIEPFKQDEEDRIRELPRNAVSTVFSYENQLVRFINTHLAWGPNGQDEPEKVRQARILRKYIESKSEKYVLTGDFNVESYTEVVKLLSQGCVNHTIENKIQNTLSPTLHRAQHLFPKGLAVDYIITSKGLKTDSFEVIQDELSDHLALRINLL